MADDALLTERLLRIVDEGRRISTYKLALLSAIINTSAERPGRDEIPTRALAVDVVRQYFHQSAPFPRVDGTLADLRQITSAASGMLTAVAQLRSVARAAGVRRLPNSDNVPDQIRAEYEAAVDATEYALVRNPIPRLQRVGRDDIEFLYYVDWKQDTTITSLRRRGIDRIRLMPGVAERLAVLGPLLRPLIELHWTAEVARMSNISTEQQVLHEHLFGTSRLSFPPTVRAGLTELQQGRCFYCDRSLPSTTHVDHFVAWSRWPNNAVENLVIADGRCNTSKSDNIAAVAHARRWVNRNDLRWLELTEIARAADWESNRARTNGLAITTYSSIAPKTPLWVRPDEFDSATGPISLN